MRQNWLDSLVKGDKVWTFCWNGEADYEIFDCWGNLDGSKGDGVYLENLFKSVFCSTKDIFQTKKEAQKAGAKLRIKVLEKEINALYKKNKELWKEKEKLQKLLKK